MPPREKEREDVVSQIARAEESAHRGPMIPLAPRADADQRLQGMLLLIRQAEAAIERGKRAAADIGRRIGSPQGAINQTIEDMEKRAAAIRTGTPAGTPLATVLDDAQELMRHARRQGAGGFQGAMGASWTLAKAKCLLDQAQRAREMMGPNATAEGRQMAQKAMETLHGGDYSSSLSMLRAAEAHSALASSEKVMEMPPQIKAEMTELGKRMVELSRNASGPYGQKAEEAVKRADLRAASLAVAMGNLELQARSGYVGQGREKRRGSASDYLSKAAKEEIDSRIEGRRASGPADMERMAFRIEDASLHIELAKIKYRHKDKEMPQGISDCLEAFRAAEERFTNGDAARARQTLGMIGDYLSLAGRKDAAGMDRMEKAMALEAKGEDGRIEHAIGSALYGFSAARKDFERLSAGWGPALKDRKQVVDTTLDSIRLHIEAGRFESAQKLSGMLTLYIGAVRKHGEKYDLFSMEKAMDAMARGNPNAEQVFAKGLEGVQLSFAKEETERVRKVGQGAWRRSGAQGDFKDSQEGRALALVDERISKGDAAGAMTLLGYVSDHYGAASGARRDGWLLSAKAPGYKAARDEISQAIGAEMSGDHGKAIELHAIARRRIAAMDAMAIDFSKTKATMDKKEGDQSALQRLSSFESSHEEMRDPSGISLEQRLKRMEGALWRGDMEGYNREKRAFVSRHNTLARGLEVQSAIDMLSSVGKTGTAIRAMNQEINAPGSAAFNAAAARGDFQAMLKGGGPDANADYARFDHKCADLERRAVALVARIKEVQRSGGAIDDGIRTELVAISAEYATLRGQIQATAHLRRQIALNSAYSTTVRMSHHARKATAGAELAACSKDLNESLALLQKGDEAGAQAKYQSAMAHRAAALYDFQAGRAFERVGEFDASLFPTELKRGSFGAYQQAHAGLFAALLKGTGGASPRMQNIQEATGLLEQSILFIDATEGLAVHDAQEFAAFQTEAIAMSNQAFRSGTGWGAVGKQMMSRLHTLQAHNKMAESAVKSGGALALSAVPVAGPWLSGFAFSAMAIDDAAKEYKATGKVSAESWMHIAMAVVPMGMSVARLGLQAASSASQMSGAAGRAAMLARGAAGVQGVEMAMMGYFTLDGVRNTLISIDQGDYAGAIMNAGMAAFPIVHSTGVRHWEARGRAKARAATDAMERHAAVSDALSDIGRHEEMRKAKADSRPVERTAKAREEAVKRSTRMESETGYGDSIGREEGTVVRGKRGPPPPEDSSTLKRQKDATRKEREAPEVEFGEAEVDMGELEGIAQGPGPKERLAQIAGDRAKKAIEAYESSQGDAQGQVAAMEALGIDVRELRAEREAALKQETQTGRENELARYEKKVNAIFDVVLNGLESDIQRIDGFQGMRMGRMKTHGGMRGILEITMLDGAGKERKAYVKMESVVAANTGAEACGVEGLVAPEGVTGSRDGKRFRTPSGQEYGIFKDAREIGERGRIELRMPDSGRFETVETVGASMLIDDIMAHPNLSDPVHREFFRLLGSTKGREQIFRAWRAYHEMSRRALLYDRRPANTMVLMVRRPGTQEVEITFQPIDTDGVGQQIGRNGSVVDFNEFHADFARSSRDMLFHMHRTLMEAFTNRLANERGAKVVIDVPTIAQLQAEFLSPTALKGATLEADSAGVRARRNAVFNLHGGDPIGIGMDVHDPASKVKVGNVLPMHGDNVRVVRDDARVYLDSRRMNDVADGAGSPTYRDYFIIDHHNRLDTTIAGSKDNVVRLASAMRRALAITDPAVRQKAFDNLRTRGGFGIALLIMNDPAYRSEPSISKRTRIAERIFDEQTKGAPLRSSPETRGTASAEEGTKPGG